MRRDSTDMAVPVEETGAGVAEDRHRPAPSAGPALRVLIVEDHRLLADALAAMFSLDDGFEVVGQTDNGADAVRLAAETGPDVILMDVGLVGLNGIEATRRITEADPTKRVLFLTMHDDDRTVTEAVAAGGAGFMPKDCEAKELFQAVRAVAAGEGFLHGRATRVLLSRVAPLVRESIQGGLTPRETDVLQLLCDGCATRQIAGALHVSEETVKSHLSRIYQKLQVPDRTQAVAVALRRGLVR